VGIHPTVVLSIAEYYNRMKVLTDNPEIRVYGGLLGVVSGKKIEVLTSFEFDNKSKDPLQIDIDLNFVEERKTLTDQLFPLYQVLGVYSTSKNAIQQESDKNLLNAMEFLGVPNPIYITLGTDLTNVLELPLTAYEFNRNLKEYIKITHTIESSDPERICLDTVIKSSDTQNNDSLVVQNMVTLKNALGVLKSNLKIINENLYNDKYLNDPEFIKQVDSMIKNYPDFHSPDVIKLMNSSFEEILVLNNICAGCVGVNFLGRWEVNQWQEKFSHN
jgi:COP9 signalosome complex subunit 6